jgi:hypothetical protein
VLKISIGRGKSWDERNKKIQRRMEKGETTAAEFNLEKKGNRGGNCLVSHHSRHTLLLTPRTRVY